jgi:FemAB-related protein (PEP-CTERM system-associated)
LFGKFLVSLPYVNSAGIVAHDEVAASTLIDRAVTLADELDVRYLELRHEQIYQHKDLNATVTSKVHMRLPLVDNVQSLRKSIPSKVRNQVRKGEKQGFAVHWGQAELLDDFYKVFSRNMRDLGTPVFGQGLFGSIVRWFGNDAEFCVVRDGNKPIAGALLVHGSAVTEVPSASSLRSYNPSNANYLMYWHLLKRAVERGQEVFDFGRSTPGTGTYKFKENWRASPKAAAWQYYVRRGTVGDVRLESGKYRRAVQLWQHVPLWMSRLLGPRIVRGIP